MWTESILLSKPNPVEGQKWIWIWHITVRVVLEMTSVGIEVRGHQK